MTRVVSLRFALIVALSFLATISLQSFGVVGASSTASGLNAAIAKIIPEGKSSEEIKNSMKVFFTKMKLRQVPLAKEQSEILLTKLYQEKRILEEVVGELKAKVNRIKTNIHQNSLRYISKVNYGEQKDKKTNRPPKFSVGQLTEETLNKRQAELDAKERELAYVQSRIDQAKAVAKNPVDFVAVPKNYGFDSPEEVQDRELDVLILDRERMEFRRQIVEGELPVSWLVDHW